ncbi:MAG: hypothetical protein LBH32_04195 [Dysgonamonadaceae bacterium]|jgi:hypothetical protein|nr:hypothetical protein [Dysgonamonadaceae bacterium]
MFLLTCCWWKPYRYAEHLTDMYYLIESEDTGLSLCKDDDIDDGGWLIIIGQTVYAAGYNNDVIIVKQHPHEFSKLIDKTITNYYILPIKNNPKNEAIGPLTLKQFNDKRKELNVPDSLQFTIEFEKLK